MNERVRARETPPIETSRPTRWFGDITAVADIDLKISGGAIFGLLGPDEAGKTTLINMLTTILPPSAGTGGVARFDVERRPQEVRRVIARRQ